MEDLISSSIKSDDELIRSIVNGEIALFELLIRRYNSLLYKISRSYGFNHQDTQDLMQDAHVAAYENLKNFEGRSSYKTWISRIMVHKCLYRINNGHGKYETVTANIALNGNQALFMKQELKPDEYAANKELACILEKSLDNLPQIYRNVFVLRELENFSIKETAYLLNITEVNVKVRLSRAKNLLQQEISKAYSQSEVYSFNLIYCDVMVQRVFDRIQKH